MRPGRRFTHEQRSRILQILSDLCLRIRSSDRIAEELARIEPELAIQSGMVRVYRRKLDAMWLASAVANTDTLKARQLAQLEMEREECWRQHARQNATARIVTKEAGGEGAEERLNEALEQNGLKVEQSNPKGKSRRKVKIEEREVSDAQWMARISAIDDQIAKLMGLYEAQKVDASLHGPDDGPIKTEHEHSFSYSDFSRVFSAVAAGTARPDGLETAAADGGEKPLDSARTESARVPVAEAGALPDGAVR